MPLQTFKILLLIARPAAGKSEVIHFLKQVPEEERKKRFYVGKFKEIDDFPMLWTWFEEDALLERMGHPRLHTTFDGYFKYNYLWDLLIERINLEYHKHLRDDRGETIIIEFSRGTEHGGFRRAFKHLSDEILQDLAILYIDVPWEESLRKNRCRFNPDRPDSILEHGLSDDKLERLYKYSDWHELIQHDSDFIEIREIKVPYVILNNTDDVTTDGGPKLGNRLETSFERLWAKYRQLHLA